MRNTYQRYTKVLLVIGSIVLFFLMSRECFVAILHRMQVSDISMSLIRHCHWLDIVKSSSYLLRGSLFWIPARLFSAISCLAVAKSVYKFTVILDSYLLNNQRKCEHGISKHCHRILFSSCKQSTVMWIWDRTMRHWALLKSDYRSNLWEIDYFKIWMVMQ